MQQELKIKVREVMTREVRTIDSLTSVREAMKQMKKQGYGSLIVDRRDADDD